MTQPKSVAVFVQLFSSVQICTWVQYDSLPEECKEMYSGQWEGKDLDLPSKNQHFFFQYEVGYYHTSELIEIREGHPLFGGDYQFYIPNYLGKNNAVLAVGINGSAVRGYFTYA